MQVIRAEVLGMCFGVRDALKAIEGLGEPEVVTIHGQLVHNEVVLDRLADRGFRMRAERDRAGVPETPAVLITAHGVSDAERDRLGAAGKRLIDTTCPLVRRAHEAAKQLDAEGRHVLVIGKRGHVEVEGLVGDLRSSDVIQSPEEVATYPHPRLGIVSQTTQTDRGVAAIRAVVAAKNPDADIKVIDTVCKPTRDHQRSLEELIDRVEAVVVVGGRNSNNTRALVERCRERGLPAWHVRGPDDLEPGWFAGVDTVGLTAGTSTLDETIDAVHEALERIGAAERVRGSSRGSARIGADPIRADPCPSASHPVAR